MNRRSFLKGSLAVGLGALAARAAGQEGNEKIAADRQAAIDILRPSPKELEHGLELHRDSLVVETYGFSPRAAVDNSVLAKLINSGASEQEVADAREDMAMTRYVTDDAERKEYLGAWDAAGVTCIVQNAGEEGNDPLRLIKRLARYTYVTDRLRDRVSRAVAVQDILDARKAGRHCLCMTTNGVPLVQEWANVTDEMRYIRTFYEFGVRMMHLTYNRRNPIGDGCGEPNDAGLSDFGRQVVAEMNRVGVIVDCAHSGQKTSSDAARASSKPMVASHTVAATLNRHVRAKTDDVIKAIVDTGGLVGICCIPDFLGQTADIAAMLNHIDYVAKKFGVDHVGIGTDVAYTSRLKPSDVPLPARGRARDPWEQLWPPGSRALGRSPKATASLAWTNWPIFTIGLVQRGYSDADIQKVIGGNMMRVLNASA